MRGPMRWLAVPVPMGECLNPNCTASRMLGRALCIRHETGLDTMLNVFAEPPEVMVFP